MKELARRYGVGSKTIRRALDYTRARKVPEDLDAVVEEETTAPGEAPGGGRVQKADPVVMVDVPGLVAEHLVDVADEPVRQALDGGQTIRRGAGLLGAGHRPGQRPRGDGRAHRCRADSVARRPQGAPHPLRPRDIRTDHALSVGAVR
ncbi:hypothetical protein [Streptomyces anulatus]|uniref:hypothetical protein n=1 Tax=Streptomyces anulatus TaxID=1892 RepID=UPI00386BC8E4